jgi:hypothetical protein
MTRNAAWVGLVLCGPREEDGAHNREALTGPEGGNPMDAMMDALLTLNPYKEGQAIDP